MRHNFHNLHVENNELFIIGLREYYYYFVRCESSSRKKSKCHETIEIFRYLKFGF